jgi:hypothetical protein
MHPKFIPNALGEFPGRKTMNRRIRVIDPLPPAVRTTRGKATPIQLAAFLCGPIFFRHIDHVNALSAFEPLELDAVADMGKLILKSAFRSPHAGLRCLSCIDIQLGSAAPIA